MQMGSIPRLSNSSAVVNLVLLLLVPSIASAQFTPQPPSSAPNAYDHPKIHSLAVAAITLTTVCFMLWAVSMYTRHRCIVRMDRRIPVVVVRRLEGLDPEVIGAIPTMVYSDVKRLRFGKGGMECPVCFSEFEDRERLRLMPNCGHGFHVDCIDAWLARHRTCPVCRADVAPGNHTSAQPASTVSSQSNCRSSMVEVVVEENRNRNMSPTDLNRILELEHTRTGSLVRSLSTGHSPIHQDEDSDHFTLRLPFEVGTRGMNDMVSSPSEGSPFIDIYPQYSGLHDRASKSDRWAPPARALPVLSRESPQR